MKKGLILSIAVLVSSMVVGNNDSTKVDNDTLMQRDFQVSFITPMGTNGMDYNQIENKVSINIFGGHHGGLNGIEVAGFANSIRKDAKGVQAAGFVNAVQGNLMGTQVAGFANYAGKVQGVQASGFVNVAKDSVEGAQVAGFVNYAHENHKGVQVAGFMNTIYGDGDGIYGSGFSNVSIGNVKGIQATGFFNAAHKGIEGVQLSGFGNYALDTVVGGQVSGFINVAQHLKGFQVGFINYSDTIEEGVMVGFLSYARKGYHQFELEGNESHYGNVSFKTGTNKFYNILSVGAKVKEEQLFWSFGYGLGSQFLFNEKLGMNVDLTAHHLNKDAGFTPHLNLLSKLKPSVFCSFHKHLTVYGGPSINLLVSDVNIYGEAPQNEGFVNESLYDKNIDNVNVKMYLGFQAGLRF